MEITVPTYYEIPCRWIKANYMSSIRVFENRIEIEIKGLTIRRPIHLKRELRILAEMDQAKLLLNDGREIARRIRYVMHEDKYRISAPKNTRKIILKAKPWVKQLFTKEFQIAQKIYQNEFATKEAIRAFEKKYGNRNSLAKLAVIIYGRKSIPQIPKNTNYIAFELAYLASLITGEKLRYIGDNKGRGIYDPKIPPKIFCPETAFLLGAWSSDGSIFKGREGRPVKFYVVSGDKGFLEIIQEFIEKLFGKTKPVIRHRKALGRNRIEQIYKSPIARALVLAGATMGHRTKVNPSFPEWIKGTIGYIRNWFRGEFIGDGVVTISDRCLAARFDRGIEIRNERLKNELKERILSHPDKKWNPGTQSYRLSMGKLSEEEKQKIPKPKLIVDEDRILSKLGLKHSLCGLEIKYYPKTNRVTAHWGILFRGKNAIHFWRFLDLEKEPWIKSEKVKEAKQKIEMKKLR